MKRASKQPTILKPLLPAQLVHVVSGETKQTTIEFEPERVKYSKGG